VKDVLDQHATTLLVEVAIPRERPHFPTPVAVRVVAITARPGSARAIHGAIRRGVS
jgi:hypothetical protein